MVGKFCFAVCSLVICSAPLFAQVTLERKFVEGAKSVSQTDMKTTQTLTLAGMNIDTKSTAFVVSTTTVGRRGADGKLPVEEKTDTLQSEISLGGGITLQFDSANPEKKADLPQLEPILDLFRAMYRLPVTVVLDAKNNVAEINLPEGEYEKLPEAAKDRFSPESRKKLVEQSLAYLPDGPVKKGDRWERSTEANLGAGQVMSFRMKFEYAGTVELDGKTFDKIMGKATEVNFAINGNPMIQVTKSDLKVSESESAPLFDRELGAMASRSSKIRIEGPLTLVVNGMELAGKLDLAIEEKTARQK